MNIVELPKKEKHSLDELQKDLNKLLIKYEDLTTAETIGVLEIFKWELINALPSEEVV